MQKRLDFFIDGADPAEIKTFKADYQKEIKSINERKVACELALEQMDKDQKIFKKCAIDLDSLVEKIKKVLVPIRMQPFFH